MNQDPKWWSVDFNPVSSDDSEETDIAEEVEPEGEPEGELDSIGRLFLDLIQNNTIPKDPSTDDPANITSGTSNPAPTDAPAQQTKETPTKKRTRLAAIKVPYSRLNEFTMNRSQPEECTQEKDAEAAKKRRTRSSTSQYALNEGIPPTGLPRRVKKVFKAPTPAHPLAGQLRVSKSNSLSVSSSGSVSTPEDFQINTE